MFLIKLICQFVLLLSYVAACEAVSGESIARNSNGDYVITYWNGNTLSQTIFTPATKISPIISSTLKFTGSSGIQYAYKVLNRADAKQPIIFFQIPWLSGITSAKPITDIPHNLTSANEIAKFVNERQMALRTPSNWNGDVMPANPSGLTIGWDYKYKHIDNDDIVEGLLPGEVQSGFGYFSRNLPGIGFAKVGGETLPAEFEDEGPVSNSEIVDKLEELEGANFLAAMVIIPTIAVPTPFDASTLLDRIRTEMNSWPAKQLLDPAYAAQLDRYMVAAAEAYRLNNAKAGKEHIKTIRKMLAKEHHNLDHDDEGEEDADGHKTATRLTIDRLAARVLDFDLRYVLKRMEPDERDHH